MKICTTGATTCPKVVQHRPSVRGRHTTGLLEPVDTFLYLGSMITEDGECTTELRTRLNRWQAIGAPLQKIWKSHSILISTKIRLMKELVWPVATNKWVLNKAGAKRDLLHIVKAMRLAYYGHTMRKQGSCLEKQIMQGTMPGAQRQGRPRTAWMDNIKTWTGLPVEKSIRMTESGQREISCGSAMDHRHEAQPCCPGRHVVQRCVKPVADRVHSTRL